MVHVTVGLEDKLNTGSPHGFMNPFGFGCRVDDDALLGARVQKHIDVVFKGPDDNLLQNRPIDLDLSHTFLQIFLFCLKEVAFLKGCHGCFTRGGDVAQGLGHTQIRFCKIVHFQPSKAF